MEWLGMDLPQAALEGKGEEALCLQGCCRALSPPLSPCYGIPGEGRCLPSA